MADSSSATAIGCGLALLVGVVSLSPTTAAMQEQTHAASFTVSQAQAGEVAYQDLCASCHVSDLAGAFEAPELAGPTFLGMWGGRPASDLFDYAKVAMPPAGRKPTDEALTHIVAYILQQNGMAAGTPLVATTQAPIARLAPADR